MQTDPIITGVRPSLGALVVRRGIEALRSELAEIERGLGGNGEAPPRLARPRTAPRRKALPAPAGAPSGKYGKGKLPQALERVLRAGKKPMTVREIAVQMGLPGLPWSGAPIQRRQDRIRQALASSALFRERPSKGVQLWALVAWDDQA